MDNGTESTDPIPEKSPLQTFHKERPYKCNQCDLSFSRAGKVRFQKKKKRHYLGIFPKRRTPPPTPPFWEPLIQKKILVFILHFRT